MRVIINIHSNRAFKITGWRARAVKINDNKEACLEEILKAIIFEDRKSLFDLLIDKGFLIDDYILFANGVRMSKNINLKAKIKDNVQIHVIEKTV